VETLLDGARRVILAIRILTLKELSKSNSEDNWEFLPGIRISASFWGYVLTATRGALVAAELAV
jgi:hypothetical protein